MPKYTFREGHVVIFNNKAEADPQEIGDALERISATHGGHLTTQRIVSHARDTKHPLHKHFEWDDRIAGEAYRREQAGQIVRSIVVKADTESGVARAFVSVNDTTGISYRSLSTVMKSADLQEKLLAQLQHALQAIEDRYKEFEDVCSLVREAREKVTAKRQAAKEDRASAR